VREYRTTEAHRARSAAYYAAHREQCAAYNAAYRAAYPDKARAYAAARRAAHREEIATYNAAYHAAHREEIAAYYAAHPEIAAKHYFRHRIGIEPPPELVALKAKHIALMREIRKVKEALHG
jgi:hypothetical protein